MRIVDLAGEAVTLDAPGILGTATPLRMRSRHQVVAMLTFPLLSLGAATGESADGAWRFEPRGTWNLGVDVRLGTQVISSFDGLGPMGPGGDQDVLGAVTGTDGSRYEVRFDAAGVLALEQGGNHLLTLEPERAGRRGRATLEFGDRVLPSADVPWLVLLLWYLRTCASADDRWSY